jgi:hypothetical protein
MGKEFFKASTLTNIPRALIAISDRPVAMDDEDPAVLS